MVNELWVEKYRPQTIGNYVFRDERQKNQVISWIEAGVTPHLLFSGIQGIGKTSLAKVIFKELKIPSADILEINASHDNGVDAFRQKVSNFVSVMPFGDFRYVLLDEADYLTLNAQAILRGLMEKFAATSRFILTCNYEHKIIPALKSRCQGFHLTRLDRGDFDVRAATILVAEGVEFDLETLDTYVRATYPDLRKCINSLQQNVSNSKLSLPDEKDIAGEADYKLQMVELFKAGQINKARKLVCSQARPEEFEDIYKFLYQNLELWGNERKQEEAILIIRDGLCNHAICADGEINLAAVLVQLANLVEGK